MGMVQWSSYTDHVRLKRVDLGLLACPCFHSEIILVIDSSGFEYIYIRLIQIWLLTGNSTRKKLTCQIVDITKERRIYFRRYRMCMNTDVGRHEYNNIKRVKKRKYRWDNKRKKIWLLFFLILFYFTDINKYNKEIFWRTWICWKTFLFYHNFMILMLTQCRVF